MSYNRGDLAALDGTELSLPARLPRKIFATGAVGLFEVFKTTYSTTRRPVFSVLPSQRRGRPNSRDLTVLPIFDLI